MIFSGKIGSKSILQMKNAMQEVLSDALQQHGQELSRQQAEAADRIIKTEEKNQKALRSLSDTVEDFLDTMQEQDEVQSQFRQQQKAAGEREHRLVELLGLYQEQMELAGQWITEQGNEQSRESLEAWKQQYAMLEGKIKTESRFCTIEDTGTVGEPVDYRLHEVLQAVEPDTKELEGTVARVCSRGMLYQGNVIKKARVIAYRKA